MDQRAFLFFRDHKRGAKSRGIEFHFTFEEWVNWWKANLGKDWLKKRGRKRGQYVMARNGDKGPYVTWNVRCITTEANLKEAGINLPFRPRKEPKYKLDHLLDYKGPKNVVRRGAKLTAEQVVEIFYAEGDHHELAARYNVTRTRIYSIKLGHVWKHITIPLIEKSGRFMADRSPQ